LLLRPRGDDGRGRSGLRSLAGRNGALRIFHGAERGATADAGVGRASPRVYTLRTGQPPELAEMSDIRLLIVDPGHFHVALVEREMYPNVAPRAHVYASVGPDLLDYLTRITCFNGRAERPTSWELEVHACPDFLGRVCREHPGTVAIFSGRNRGKIERV